MDYLLNCLMNLRFRTSQTRRKGEIDVLKLNFALSMPYKQL